MLTNEPCPFTWLTFIATYARFTIDTITSRLLRDEKSNSKNTGSTYFILFFMCTRKVSTNRVKRKFDGTRKTFWQFKKKRH